MAIYKHTTNTAIEKCIEVHGDRYDYSKLVYIGSNSPITIICKIHGEFSIRFANHTTLKRGCHSCTKQACDYTRTSLEQFLVKSTEKHGNKFDYSLVEYKSNKDKVKIICPKHGVFEQIPQNHYRYDCLICSREIGTKRLNDNNCFSKSGFKGIAKGRLCTFYVIKCWNKTESFYKIGITTGPVTKRFNHVKSMPYSFEILKEVLGEAEYIWTLERDLKIQLKSKYTPSIKFGGSVTECYSDVEEINEALEILL